MLTAEQDTLSRLEPRHRARWWRFIRRNPTMVGGLLLLGFMVAVAVGAPAWSPVDPQELNPIERLHPPSAAHWFGTDMLGRDLYSRTIYGSRISLLVGVCV